MQGSTTTPPTGAASSGAKTPEPVTFLGLDFQPRTARQAARTIAARALGADSFWYVVTPNVDHMVRLQREEALRSLYDEADLILNDSRILELLARVEGIDLRIRQGQHITQHAAHGVLHPVHRLRIHAPSLVHAAVAKRRRRSR